MQLSCIIQHDRKYISPEYMLYGDWIYYAIHEQWTIKRNPTGEHLLHNEDSIHNLSLKGRIAVSKLVKRRRCWCG